MDIPLLMRAEHTDPMSALLNSLLVESVSRIRDDHSRGKDLGSAWGRAGVRVSDEVTPAELGRSLARIEMKLDRAIDDHELRLRRLERWMWTAMGFGAVGAASGFGALMKAISG